MERYLCETGSNVVEVQLPSTGGGKVAKLVRWNTRMWSATSMLKSEVDLWKPITTHLISLGPDPSDTHRYPSDTHLTPI